MSTDDELTNERRVQLFLEAADSLIEAAKEEQEAAREATAALLALNGQINSRFNGLAQNVSSAIGDSADKTATKAARLLTEHFRAADKAATHAREGYERAAKGLNRRIWAGFVLVQLSIIVITALAVFLLVPSRTEIQRRQAELDAIAARSQQISVVWGNCQDGGRVVPCLRTDESAGKTFVKSGETWRIPWHGK